MTAQFGWWVGLLSSVLVAIAGQAELVGEPWRHWLTIAAIIATAINGYMLNPGQRAWDRQTERRVSDETLSNIHKGAGV